jgi:hypothetical protein
LTFSVSGFFTGPTPGEVVAPDDGVAVGVLDPPPPELLLPLELPPPPLLQAEVEKDLKSPYVVAGTLSMPTTRK